ncbi:hypothetical protein AOQ84DRAFT_288722 [Glonium stellatum]|uniref:C2H2-type domain-containing protein n=1 Tax=Glonium stellatum TaxID=574774 RepID=A0A8E2F665_9PEZI|nr:hypothetical protein AOQ84DRAFT_288722 [Glonium stellatum]
MTSLELVLKALDAANIGRLRTTIEKICEQSDVALDLFCNELLVTQSDLDKHNKDSNGSENSINVTSSKRKREEYVGVRYATCEQCDEEFDATENGEESCQWHGGDLVIDEEHDIWFEWEPYQGERNTDENRKDCPEAFIWTCCERRGDGAPCETGKHVAKDIPKRVSPHVPSTSPRNVRRCLPLESNSLITTYLEPRADLR